MVRILYVLLDGVGDRPVPQLGGKTPLQAAKTPNMRELARNSVMGQVYSVGKGIAPESDIAVFNMLGYSFREDYVGRGVVEAVGADMEFKTGDVALRANFATVNDAMEIIDRRAGRDVTKEDGDHLAREIQSKLKFDDPKVSFSFKHTQGHRCVLVMRHPLGLSGRVTNTDPGYVRVGSMGVASGLADQSRVVPCKPMDGTPQAKRTAELVNEFTRKSYQILKASRTNEERIARGTKPANIVLLRDAGDTLPKLETLRSKYNLEFGAIVDMPVELGISKLVGFRVYRSMPSREYSAKVELTVNALKVCDVVYIHIKGPDEPGHDGLWDLKTQIISEIDEGYFGKLLGFIRENRVTVAVSADHSTPCTAKAHTDDPVPLMISGSKLGTDGSESFDEAAASRGSLGTMLGKDVISKVISIAY
jgi:2,3-bisphosphoglycerate-independent phosphoglycerate mutase